MKYLIPVIDNAITTTSTILVIKQTLERYINVLNNNLDKFDLWLTIESNKVNHYPEYKNDTINCFYISVTYHFYQYRYNFIDREYIPIKNIVTKNLSEIEKYIKENIIFNYQNYEQKKNCTTGSSTKKS